MRQVAALRIRQRDRRRHAMTTIATNRETAVRATAAGNAANIAAIAPPRRQPRSAAPNRIGNIVTSRSHADDSVDRIPCPWDRVVAALIAIRSEMLAAGGAAMGVTGVREMRRVRRQGIQAGNANARRHRRDVARSMIARLNESETNQGRHFTFYCKQDAVDKTP